MAARVSPSTGLFALSQRQKVPPRLLGPTLIGCTLDGIPLSLIQHIFFGGGQFNNI
jgi:hypothetical protein